MSNDNISDLEILKNRAAAFATQVIQADDRESLFVLAFQLDQEKYGIEDRHIEQVLIFKDLTPLPNTAPYILGVINVHGDIIVVFDIKKLLNININKKASNKNLDQIIIVIRAGQDLFGILIDNLEGIISVPNSILQDALPTLTGLRARILKAITNDQRLILDPKKFLQEKQIIGNL